MSPPPAIHRETVDGVPHLATVYRGVGYVAWAVGAGWEVQSRRLALGPDHPGTWRRFASTEALATGLRAFAALRAEEAPAVAPVESSRATVRQTLESLRSRHRAALTPSTLEAFARQDLGPEILERVSAAQALILPDHREAERLAREDAVTAALGLIGRWHLVRSLLPGAARA